MATGPLADVRILEVSQIIAGPFAGMLLSDMGADVIKIEPPQGGEPWRQFAQFMPGESKAYAVLNRGKRSLALDLSSADGQQIAHDLVREVDVVMINYRPGVAQRIALDEPTLRALNPSLIYVDNTAFGHDGPWAGLGGYNIVVQAVTGLMAREGRFDEQGTPQVIQASAMADFATGLAMAWSVCAALFNRERTGRGESVSTTLLATALALQSGSVARLPAADADVRAAVEQKIADGRAQGLPFKEIYDNYDAAGRGARAGNIFYRTFLTQNGAIAIGALSPGLRARVRQVLETDWMYLDGEDFDPRSDDWQARARAAVEAAQAKVRAEPTDVWVERFEAEGVPVGPVNFPEEMIDHEQVLTNDLIVDLEHDLAGPIRMVGPMVRFRDAPLAAQSASPPLGRDSAAILDELGYDAARVSDLQERGIIG